MTTAQKQHLIDLSQPPPKGYLFPAEGTLPASERAGIRVRSAPGISGTSVGRAQLHQHGGDAEWGRDHHVDQLHQNRVSGHELNRERLIGDSFKVGGKRGRRTKAGWQGKGTKRVNWQGGERNGGKLTESGTREVNWQGRERRRWNEGKREGKKVYCPC